MVCSVAAAFPAVFTGSLYSSLSLFHALRCAKQKHACESLTEPFPHSSLLTNPFLIPLHFSFGPNTMIVSAIHHPACIHVLNYFTASRNTSTRMDRGARAQATESVPTRDHSYQLSISTCDVQWQLEYKLGS